MKITLSIFNSTKVKNDDIKVKIILNVFIGLFLFVIFQNYSLLFMTTNFSAFFIPDITIENIVSQNLILNKALYRYSHEKNVEKQEAEYIPNDAEKLIDKIAKDNMSTLVFNNNLSDITLVMENNTYQKMNVCGVDITNYSTNRNIDFTKILSLEDKSFEYTDEIAIYTTHTSESYSSSQNYTIPYSSAARSLDGNYNMLNIATKFARNLNSKGINTVCSLNPHDYGEYNSAYSNSRNTLSEIIRDNPNVKIAIDVHRDAIEDLTFAPKLDIMGYNVACVMLVMGIGYDGDINPYYEQNLKFALQLQMLGNKIYPGLFRPMIIRNSVYNQDLMENSFLIEVGATGNTIDEAVLSTRCLANLLNIMYNH